MKGRNTVLTLLVAGILAVSVVGIAAAAGPSGAGTELHDRLQTRDMLRDGSCTEAAVVATADAVVATDGDQDQVRIRTQDKLRDGSCDACTPAVPAAQAEGAVVADDAGIGQTPGGDVGRDRDRDRDRLRDGSCTECTAPVTDDECEQTQTREQAQEQEQTQTREQAQEQEQTQTREQAQEQEQEQEQAQNPGDPPAGNGGQTAPQMNRQDAVEHRDQLPLSGD